MIEAAFGQGEVVVSGLVEPDTYVVDKNGLRLVRVRVGTQHFKIVRGPDGEDQRIDLGSDEGGRRVLETTNEGVLEVARLGLVVEQQYGSPQDTEWAMAVWWTLRVRSRPVTAFRRDAPAPKGPSGPRSGLAASRAKGIGSGTGPALARRGS